MTNNASIKRPRRMAREPKADTSAPLDKAGSEDCLPKQSNDPASPKAPSKIDTVLSLLKRSGGASLDELVQATGWLPHSTRAALTGLKKKGHAVERTKVEGVSRYALVESVPQ